MLIFQYLLHDCRGVTSIEYAIIAALIALGTATTVNAVGDRLGYVMATLETAIAAPPGNAPNAP